MLIAIFLEETFFEDSIYRYFKIKFAKKKTFVFKKFLE